MSHISLATAIVSEVIATTALKASDAFTKPLPSIVVLVGYSTAFYFLSLCLQTMQIGVAYAICCGVGIVLVTISAAIIYRQFPDAWALLGISLIIAGVAVLNMLSKSVVN